MNGRVALNDGQLLIKRIEPSEVPRAAEMYVRSMVTMLRAILRPNQIRDEKDYRNHFVAKIVKNTDVWVAVRGEQLVGILAMEDDWIDQLYVDSVAQRQGVGTAFINKARLYCRHGTSDCTGMEGSIIWTRRRLQL